MKAKGLLIKAMIPVFCLASVGFAQGVKGRGDASETSVTRDVRRYVANELIIQYKAGSDDNAKIVSRTRIFGFQKETLRSGAADAAQAKVAGKGVVKGDLDLVQLPENLTVPQSIEILKQDPNVEFAEPNWVYTHTATSNDPLYTGGSLWGMYGDGTSPANQYGCQAGEAWAANHTGSSTVYVGIIDEGVQVTHPDLQANMWVNPFDPIDGVDNDGNGYKDDVNGWDFAGNNNSVYDGGSRGRSDTHGTHVAGTIGAKGGNGVGVAGVCWNVKMISGKFLGSQGGTTANAIKAVDYFTDLKTRHGLDIVATNNSWGGGGFSQALFDAIQRANNANILFIAAAGNGGSDGVGDNNDSVANYPSNYTNSNVIAVASITSTGAISSFSNYGATTVDIGAPGSSIQSTLPFSKYGAYSGTSMATPHVTGGVALYAASSASRGAALKSAVLAAAVPTPSLAGKCVTGGRLNVSGF